jgi:hypothetical protein
MRSGRRDEDGDGRVCGEHPRDDGAGRVDQSAGRAQQEDQKRRALAVRAIHGLDHVLRGNGLDERVNFRHQHHGGRGSRQDRRGTAAPVHEGAQGGSEKNGGSENPMDDSACEQHDG